MSHPIMTELERQSRRNMLRYHVGQAMFCACGASLDVSRAIEVDYKDARGNLIQSVIRCASCYKPPILTTGGLTVEINDGRELFPPPAPRAPAQRSVKREDPIPGRTYLVKHSGREVRFRYERKVDRAWRGQWGGDKRAVYHFVGVNLSTGRQIELKSRGKFLREVE